jgi:hypothetical protein
LTPGTSSIHPIHQGPDCSGFSGCSRSPPPCASSW